MHSDESDLLVSCRPSGVSPRSIEARVNLFCMLTTPHCSASVILCLLVIQKQSCGNSCRNTMQKRRSGHAFSMRRYTNVKLSLSVTHEINILVQERIEV